MVYLLVTDMVSVDPSSQPLRDREIYPNAPLRLVAAELRYPLSPRLASSKADAVLERLGDILPIFEEDQPLMSVTVGAPGVEPMPAQLPSRRMRLLSRGRDLAATITGTNAIIETTTYERFEAFQRVLDRVFDALENLGPPVGVERLGLRYIDEIRVANIAESPGDWHTFVDSSLASAADLATGALAGSDYRPKSWQGLVQLAGSEGRAVNVRYGAGLGPVVDPNGPLHFPAQPDQRPVFIIDIDSFWDPSQVADFSVPSLVEECQRLHQPVRQVFERAITDRLRDEVLRAPKEG